MTGMYEEEDYIEDRSCCRAQVGCLCGTSSCRLCCRFCPSVSESTSTRIVYIVFLMFSVVIMALMMSIRVQKAIMGMFPDHSVVCEWIGAGKNCEAAMGYMAVYRLGFAVSCYHFLLMLITCGVKSSRDCRAGFHNGMWFYKFLLLITICIGSFFIPDPMDLFIYVWMYTAMSGAALFIVIQLMLLVFMYHSWTDKLMARVDNGGSPFCWYGVFSLTAATIVYSACACCVFLMYYYFTLDEGWDIICWLIFINVAACIVVSLVALSKQGPKDFRLRLLHSSLISLYVMYLTWTAIASVPHNYRNSDKWENSSVWIGAGHDVRSDYPDDDDDDDDGEGDGNEEKIWAEEILPYVIVWVPCG
ncbi:serine incorporator 5-like isoform X3 [Panulirus ornatus]|uniref:serine incorporator 5-like isoform X3 n=1 Tax=Panulirus ornatus TaxID=150431 RepID=UPI003A892ECF